MGFEFYELNLLIYDYLVFFNGISNVCIVMFGFEGSMIGILWEKGEES